MSEYSQSYHLLSSEQEDARRLLEAASLEGWVLPPGDGWVTFVAREDFTGEANPALRHANDDLLLFYVNAEDHGWAFDLFDTQTLLSAYKCEWIDVVDQDNTQLRLDLLVELLVARGVQVDRGALAQALDVHSLDDVINGLGPNPGHQFASAIGLTWYEWMSSGYIEGGRPDLPPSVLHVR